MTCHLQNFSAVCGTTNSRSSINPEGTIWVFGAYSHWVDILLDLYTGGGPWSCLAFYEWLFDSPWRSHPLWGMDVGVRWGEGWKTESQEEEETWISI